MKTRLQNNKEQIFCDWRKKWVRLTPEEWVRQQLLHRMVESLGYPASLIAVEVPFVLADKKYRADAIVYNSAMQPLILVECKAETVELNQKTLDQALAYNRQLRVPYLLLHNGVQTIFVAMYGEKAESTKKERQDFQPRLSFSIPRYVSVLTNSLAV